MAIYVGSARHDENGKYSKGSVGDSLQRSLTNDTIGEVSMQKMYKHSKGWYILRPKSIEHANIIALKFITACNNPNIGYDQGNRLGIVNYGIDTKTKTECDCSSLARQAIKEATGIDPGNFTTANEASALEATGLFEKRITYVSQTKTPVYNGDILVTKTKGHTVCVVSGNPRIITAISSSTYTKTQCVKDIQTALGGLAVDGLCGEKTLAKLPTLSKTRNRKHKIVKYVQKYLNSLNFDAGTPDSIFGTQTHNAVVAWQKANGLSADGVIGKNTWKKLIGM